MNLIRSSLACALSLTLAATLSVSALSLAGSPARAGEPAIALTRHAQAGMLRAGETALAALAEKSPADPEARMALGFARFARAVETLGQNFHRYGFDTPGNSMLPLMRLPVPVNDNPEAIDYAKLRAVYVTLLADLALAERTLAGLPPGAFKLPLDLNTVKLNFIGGERGGETLGLLFQQLTEPPMRARRRNPPAAVETLPAFNVAFDRADALWLRGYINLLSAALEFVLAHDWRESYEAAGQRFFKGARTDARLADDTEANALTGRDGGAIADFIAMAHLVRWPATEPERLKKAHAHLKSVISLSRLTWQEILAETDDDREWLPGPKQKNAAFGALEVTQERVDGWLAALDTFEAALDGKKLIPHWRFKQGIDLKAVFFEPRAFDLVLWVTGHAAMPYLKPGEVISQSDWAQWQRIFSGNFLAYAFWFN